MDADIEEFISMGANTVLTKPLKINQLDYILEYVKTNGFISKRDSSGRYLFS